MAEMNGFDPESSSRIIDQIKDPASGSYLELPAIELLAIHKLGGLVALQPFAAVCTVARLGRDVIVETLSSLRHLSAQLLPVCADATSEIPESPAAGIGGAGNSPALLPRH